MLPQDVGLAVGVEIAHGLHAPTLHVVRGAIRKRRVDREAREAVHQPHAQLARAQVLPQEIGLAVGIEVRGASQLPFAATGVVGLRLQHALAHAAVHQPDAQVTRLRVLPDEVALAVGIEVGQRHQRPRRLERADDREA